MQLNLHKERTPKVREPSRFVTLGEKTETEMRRRLWWHIIVLDVQIAEDIGSDPMLWEGMWQVRMPGNLDDVELDASSELPLPPNAGEIFDPDTYAIQNAAGAGEQRLQHDRRTDMSFALLQLEMNYAMRRFAFSEHFCRANGYEYLSTQTARVQFLETLMRSIDQRYLQYCNRNDMFSFFERNAAKLMLSRHLMIARKDGPPTQTMHNCVQVLEAAAAMRKTHTRWAWLLRSSVELDTLELLWQCLHDITTSIDYEELNQDEVRHAWTLAEIAFQRGKEDELELCYTDKWARIEKKRDITVAQEQAG